MIDEGAVRQLARQAIQAGKLPTRRPAHVLGGNGIGTKCAMCGNLVIPCHRTRRTARFLTVNAPPNENRHDGAIRTLGDLLYADRQRTRISEEEWIGLVRSIAAGDQAALRALYQRAHRIVFTLTMRISGNQQTAEELTLDVFHDVWRRASAYDPRNGPVLGWLMNQARSRAIDRLRHE